MKTTQAGGEGQPALNSRDELYEAAIDVVVREGRGSVSLLQRTLGVGYGRAARLIDFMAEDGIVGPYNGSQAREILLTLEQWQEKTGQAGVLAPLDPAPRHNNKILLAPAEDSPPRRSSLAVLPATVTPAVANVAVRPIRDEDEEEDGVDEGDNYDDDEEELDEEEEGGEEEGNDDEDDEEEEDDAEEEEEAADDQQPPRRATPQRGIA